MKKIVSILGTLIILVIMIISVFIITKNSTRNDDKLKIVATLFPQYDFVKVVGGDKIQVSLLLPPGAETHNFEPTPQNIVEINDSDLFIYTGKYMEPWVETISKSIDKDTIIVDASNNIDLIKIEELHNGEEHDHENDHEHDHGHENDHDHEYDTHIWLDPTKAIKMVENIRDALCQVDPENSEYYKKNASDYIKELIKLDEDIQKTIKSVDNPIIAFGGPFAYSYFLERYQIDFISAYESCGEEAEPSVVQLKKVIDVIKEKNLPVIFYKELTKANIAETIVKETGATPLVFNSIHSVSKEELDNGESYISLMKKNLENLKIGLNIT